MKQTLEIFVSHAESELALANKLEACVSALTHSGAVRLWTAARLQPGQERSRERQRQLESAPIALLLVSSEYFASPQCNREMMRALKRHQEETCRVIPILCAPCDWIASPLYELQALPKDGKPVSLWSSRDQAWTEIARELRVIVEGLGGVAAPSAAADPTGTDYDGAGASPARQPNRALQPHQLLAIAETLRDELRDGGVDFANFLAHTNLRQGTLGNESWFELTKRVHAGAYAELGDQRDAVSSVVRVAQRLLPKNRRLVNLLQDLGG